MPAINDVYISPDGKYVTMNKKKTNNIENHDDDTIRCLQIIFRKNTYKHLIS